MCLAVPSQALEDALESVCAGMPAHVGVLVLSKGLVAPAGTPPTGLVLERAGDRPVACLGGPAHAGEAVRAGAAVTVASADRIFASVLASAFRRAGLHCDTSSDLVGVELAGAAKNAAALAAGAALSAGANAAGVAFISGWPETGSTSGPTRSPTRAHDAVSSLQWIGTKIDPRRCPSLTMTLTVQTPCAVRTEANPSCVSR